MTTEGFEGFDESELRYFTIVAEDGTRYPNNATTHRGPIEDCAKHLEETWRKVTKGLGPEWRFASIEHQPEGKALDVIDKREVLAVAEELDVIAEREEKAIEELSKRGIHPHTKQLNYPSEQRELAVRLRRAIRIKAGG